MTAVKAGVVPAIVKLAEHHRAQLALRDSAGGALFFLNYSSLYNEPPRSKLLVMRIERNEASFGEFTLRN